MAYRTIRPFAMAVGMSTSLLLTAQVPLQPQWSHTWPYGADQPSLMTYLPAWKDNLVVVDPVTGLVHATVSDEGMLFSPRFELLHTFASDGTDLTGPDPIVVGPTPFAELYDHPYNGSSVTSFSVHDGALLAGLTNKMPDLDIYWSNHFEGGALTGGRWRVINNIDQVLPQDLKLTTDGEVMLLHAPASSLIHAHDVEGWFQWRVELPGPADQIVLSDGVAYALVGTTVQRIDLSTGTLLSQVALGNSAQLLVVKDASLYTAAANFVGTVQMRKWTMDGTLVWQQLFPVGLEAVLTGLVVDDADRAWATACAYDFMEENMVGGYLLGVDANGSALETRTYGDALHSLATDGSMLYMTGWSDNTGTETFLIGVDIAMITGLEDGTNPVRSTRVWPVPANTLLTVELPDGTWRLELLDAVGRVVGQWSASGSNKQHSVDVSAVSNGRYVLIARGAEGLHSSAVIIAR
jgi:hypothetical protein